MRLYPIMVFIAAAAISASIAVAWNGDWGGDEEAIQEQRVEFKQLETKDQMQKMNPPAVVAPGPEGGPEQSNTLLRDRLRILEEKRALAVKQGKPNADISGIDAQIKDLQQQLQPAQ